ncbi:MAG: hypothetical protein ABI771_14285, partial [Betaproteobacteria bacterium]
KKSFLLACVFMVCSPVHADRITRMNQTELCTYTAQLEVAAYYYFEQGKPLADVIMKWHGDETQNEMDFVNQTVADAYAWLGKWKDASNSLIPVTSFGDMVYQACMSKKDS